MSFMNLPPELRMKVYRNLLSSDPKPDNRPFDASLPVYTTTSQLYPSILRVNKQVCLEASHILYTSNTLTLDLKHNLGKSGKYGNVKSENNWCFTAREQPLVLTKGVIYPQGLQHMRHILIRFDTQALRLKEDIPVWFTGRTLAVLLRCLGAGSKLEVDVDSQRTLKLHILVPQHRMGIQALAGFECEQNEGTADVMWYLKLLENVKKRRKVEVQMDVVHQGVSVGRIGVERLGLGLVEDGGGQVEKD